MSFLKGSIFSILCAYLPTRNHTNLENPITNQIYMIGYPRLVRYGLLNDPSTIRNAAMIAENTMIERSPDHLDSLSVALRFENVIFSCFSALPLAGNKENATINHSISIANPILKGNFKLISVKNGKATIKNILKNDTHPLIEDDILLNLSSIFRLVRVSWRNAEVFPVENASIPRDINREPIRKNRKLYPITNIILESNKHILAITIVVLFPNLSPIIPAGI